MADKKQKLENVKLAKITEEMQQSYLDYAMSVIVSRALPDVRDGLKPVHRRILYAAYKMGLNAGGSYRKSANITGITMARYHPHGDQAIYDALTRMAQDFSLRYPLINGQGNWGSIDGDAAAAQRYTEAKLSQLGEELLKDIEKETVDFRDNYDGTKKEPVVLPSPLPNLLLNGTLGIAVGMATSIPTHNLTEVIDAVVHLIDNPKATVEDLVEFIKGPDFPTGGEVYGYKDIVQAYALGKGPMVTRAKTEIEEGKKGRSKLIINELTYNTNKAQLLQKIADLVKNDKIKGIKNIRDESDKEGIRIVLDFKKGAYPQKALNKLFKYTDLQKTFHLNMVALVDGIQPRILSLKTLLNKYIEHRKEIVARRTKHDLAKAKGRIHILQGLNKALNEINKVIATIKQSRTRETAHKNLRTKFKLSKIQATAILEMKLQTLAGLERKKINDELEEKKKLAKRLEALLKSPKKISDTAKKELLAIKEQFGDKRRTKVFKAPVEGFKEMDLIPDEETIITFTKNGYIKRVNPQTYRIQKRGGKGIVGIKTREKDFVQHFFTCSTHDNLLFFSAQGKIYKIRAYQVPEASRVSRGKAIVSVLGISSEDRIAAVVPLKEKNNAKFLAMTTKKGIIKKTAIERFKNIRTSGLIAIKLKKDDNLRWVRGTSGNNEIILITEQGQAIRFSEKDVRAMGRTARGVKGINLRKGDCVTGMDVIIDKDKKKKKELLIVTENGYGKKTDLSKYKEQGRGGTGIKTAKITPKTGKIIRARIVDSSKEGIVAISQKGQVIRILLKNISSMGRATQGVRIMRLGEKDKVASIACI